jgi:hypothetical protein
MAKKKTDKAPGMVETVGLEKFYEFSVEDIFKISENTRKEYGLSKKPLEDIVKDLLQQERNLVSAFSCLIKCLSDIQHAVIGYAKSPQYMHHHSLNSLQLAVVYAYGEGRFAGLLYKSSRQECLTELTKCGEKILSFLLAVMDKNDKRTRGSVLDGLDDIIAFFEGMKEAAEDVFQGMRAQGQGCACHGNHSRNDNEDPSDREKARYN